MSHSCRCRRPGRVTGRDGRDRWGGWDPECRLSSKPVGEAAATCSSGHTLHLRSYGQPRHYLARRGRPGQMAVMANSTEHAGRWKLEDRFASPWHYLPVEVPPGAAALRVE